VTKAGDIIKYCC